MGLDTAPLSCSLISFSEDLLSSFIGRPRSYATVRPFSIFKTGFVAFVFPICRGNRLFPPSSFSPLFLHRLLHQDSYEYGVPFESESNVFVEYRRQSRSRLRQITILINLGTVVKS